MAVSTQSFQLTVGESSRENQFGYDIRYGENYGAVDPDTLEGSIVEALWTFENSGEYTLELNISDDILDITGFMSFEVNGVLYDDQSYFNKKSDSIVLREYPNSSFYDYIASNEGSTIEVIVSYEIISTTSIRVGSLTPDNFMLGSTQVDKIMLGTNQVF